MELNEMEWGRGRWTPLCLCMLAQLTAVARPPSLARPSRHSRPHTHLHTPAGINEQVWTFQVSVKDGAGHPRVQVTASRWGHGAGPRGRCSAPETANRLRTAE